MSLIATSGGADSNAFCDVTTADTYHSERLFNSEWSDASNLEKEASLIRSTALLNELDWNGSVDSDSTQALRSPRKELYDRDGRELTDIPTFLINATCELALMLLKSEFVTPSQLEKRTKVGPIETEFYEGSAYGGTLPREIMAMVSAYITSGVNNVKLVRA